MPYSLENQFIADTFKALLHTGNISLSSGAPDATIYSGDGFESSLSISTALNGIKVNGNATIYGDVISNKNGNFSGFLSSGSHTVIGDSNISGSVDIGGDININGSHAVTGDSNISGTLSSGSHTVIGDSNISGTARIGNGATVIGSLNSGSHTVIGNSNISGTARIGNSATVIGSLSSGSHTVTGNSRITNRIDTDVIYANTYLNLPAVDTKADIVNHIYPVGSIFLSFTNTNPSSRFTGTTWVQVSQGRFVVGVGTGEDGVQNRIFTAGNNSGEYQHQLNVSEMPSHNHTQPYTGGDRCDGFDCVPITSGGTNLYPQAGSGQGGYRNGNTMITTGGSQYHENTPPGFGLYVWQRTS